MNDRDDVFRRFEDENPTAVRRMTDILGPGYNQERAVKAAVGTRTGIPRLDLALYGGLPSGVTEIFGPQSVGKTALLGAILAGAQQQGKSTALVATEDLDSEYWQALGVDLHKLLIFQTEDARDIADLSANFLREPHSVLGIDSISALRIMEEDDIGPLEDYIKWKDMVLDLLKQVNEKVSIHSALVVTSQVRARKSVDPAKTFAGGTESASRGVLEEFQTRLELSRRDVQDKQYTMVVNVIANVFGPPAKLIELPVVKGTGVDLDLDLIELAVEFGLIEKKGSWYFIIDKFYHGAYAAAEALKERPWMRKLLLNDRNGIYQHLCS